MAFDMLVLMVFLFFFYCCYLSGLSHVLDVHTIVHFFLLNEYKVSVYLELKVYFIFKKDS